MLDGLRSCPRNKADEEEQGSMGYCLRMVMGRKDDGEAVAG